MQNKVAGPAGAPQQTAETLGTKPVEIAVAQRGFGKILLKICIERSDAAFRDQVRNDAIAILLQPFEPIGRLEIPHDTKSGAALATR